MSNVGSCGRNCFAFVWRIENFLYCFQKPNEYLSSPKFTVDALKKTAWQVNLFPRGHKENTDYIGVFLNRRQADTKYDKVNLIVDCELSLLANEGSLKIEKRAPNTTYATETSKGFSTLIKQKKVLDQKSDFLPDGTLIVQCRLWMDPELLEPGVCMARTTIEFERKSFIWASSDICSISRENSMIFTSKDPFAQTTVFRIADGSDWYDAVDIVISQAITKKPNYVACAISQITPSDGVVATERHHHWFEVGKAQQTSFQFLNWKSKPSSSSNLSENVLYCGYAISFGKLTNEIEYHSLAKVKGFPSLVDESEVTLENNLKVLYQDKTLCDMNLRAGSKVFPVHKAILCARSPVFKAMMTRDMSEKNSDFINIEDLDADTVERMLFFMYTDTVEDLTSEEASKLYISADKYDLPGLKKQCSSSIKMSLSSLNACNVLAFADMHHDEDLKQCVQNFIFKYDDEIICSDEWEQFVIERSALALETLNSMYRKKLVF